MSRFATLFARFGRPWLEQHLARSGVVYVAVDDSETELAAAIVGAEWIEEELDRGRTNRRKRRRCELSVSTAELADVPLNGRFKIGGETWSAEKILGKSDGQIRVQLVRQPRMETSRPNLRSK